MTVLITGFEPFGPVRHNPSEALLAGLPTTIGGAPVRTAVLPVDTEAIADALAPLYAEAPQVVLHLGVARERERITLERVARNRLDFDLPDNAGRRVHGRPIVPGAPETRPTRLPVDAILAAWAEAGLPAGPSDDAGLYLCNQAFFLALEGLPASVPAGFVHVAPDETMAPDGPHLPLDIQRAAVLTAARMSLAAVEARA